MKSSKTCKYKKLGFKLCHLLILHFNIIYLMSQTGSFQWNLSMATSWMDLMNGHTRFLRKYLWKLKIPLKIKITWLKETEWVLKKAVFLTQGRPLSICFSHVLLPVLYGILFILLIFFLHQPILEICMGIEWNWQGNEGYNTHMSFSFMFGRYGIAEIFLF